MMRDFRHVRLSIGFVAASAMAWPYTLLAAPTVMGDASTPRRDTGPTGPQTAPLRPPQDPAWVKVAGKADPLVPDQLSVPSLALPQLIASCLEAPAPEHQSCFAKAAQRVAKLHRDLSGSLERKGHPLHIPASAKGPATHARARVLKRLESLARRLTALSTKEHAPSPTARRKAIAEIRGIAATLVAFANLQRGRVGIAVRGGVSMGAYQAGVLYYLGEFLKAHARRWGSAPAATSSSTGRFSSTLLPHVEVATGSSAGALNALLASYQGCQGPQPDPTKTALYESWVRVGMTGRHGRPGLRRSKKRTRRSSHLLNPSPIDEAAQRLAQRMQDERDYQPGCAIDLGITVTRLDNNQYPVMGLSKASPPIQVRRARERFAFALRVPEKRPSGQSRTTLWVRNRRPSESLHRQGLAGIASRDNLQPFYLAYGTPSQYQHPIAIRDLVESAIASGSVPIAFAPRILPFTAFDAHGKVSHPHSGYAPFADGGIFDSRPLSFAIELSRWRRADRVRTRLAREQQSSKGLPFDPRRSAWNRAMHLGLSQATSQREWDLWKARADSKHQLRLDPFSIAPTESAQWPTAPWQELLDLIPANPQTFVFVEPTLTRWTKTKTHQKAPGHEARHKEPKLVNSVMGHLGNFVSSARDANLLTSIERRPWMQDSERGDLRPRVVIPRRDLPIAGERLKRFLAFFEQDFRVFDFFVGVADAWRFAQHDDPVFRLSGSLPSVEDPRFRCLLDYHKAAKKSLPARLPRHELARYLPHCTQAALVGPHKHAKTEQLGETLNALERESIQRIDTPKPPGKHQEDLALAQANVAANNFAAMLVAMHNFKQRVETQADQQAPERDFDSFFEELGRAGFRYVDMVALAKSLKVGLARFRYQRHGIRGEDARKIVRHTLEDAIRNLAKSQRRSMDTAGVSIFGKALADLYRPFDPRLSADLGLTYNGIEARLSGHPFFNRFRMDWALVRLYRLGTHTVRSRSSPKLPGYQQILLDMDLGIRAGARLFHLSRFLRMSAMAGPTLSFTYSLGDSADEPANQRAGQAFMRRVGLQLGLELLLLRRLYVEFTGTHWFAEHARARWPNSGITSRDWYTVRHSSSASPCQWGNAKMSVWSCLQSSMSAGWRWDF